MKTLYLMRHAKSSWDDPGQSDHDRPLTPRGLDAARRVGQLLADRKVEIEFALCSTAARARETARTVMAVCAPNVEILCERTLYLCGASPLLQRLQGLPDHVGSALLVAHNPDIHQLANVLDGSGPADRGCALSKDYPTGALSIFTFDIVTWRALGVRSGRLIDFILPRTLV